LSTTLSGARPRIFAPILAGASLHDRLMACLGAGLGLAVMALVCGKIAPFTHLPALAAPIGASALLVFAVPASPLAQPWPVIGGNVISAAVGVAVARLVPDVALAAGLALALAMMAMSLLRCLHPPGGAAAITAVIGGAAVTHMGYALPFVVMALNAVLLVAAGWLFHRFSKHAYPHRAGPKPSTPGALHREDIDLALRDMGETFDIDAADLEQLLERAELHAAARKAAARPPRRRPKP
jgi:CBS domain-containing membrane protein